MIQRNKTYGLIILSVVFWLIYSPSSLSQTKESTVSLKIDNKDFVMDKGRKSYRGSFDLYSVINGQSYLISHLAYRFVNIPEPLLDPAGKYIVYAENTGCGFEGEGMAIFISDVYGKKKTPILGSCRYLRPTGFLTAKGKNYLQITSESESPETDFWIYDLSRGEFVLHADGEIQESEKGIYNYGKNDADGNFKPIGKVTSDTLINRGAPLKLLPRYPIHGLTLKGKVPVYESVHCSAEGNKPMKIIGAAGSKVLILIKCEDGGYEIYVDGIKGKVSKGVIKPIQFGN
jgi:hypothetical protein